VTDRKNGQRLGCGERRARVRRRQAWSALHANLERGTRWPLLPTDRPCTIWRQCRICGSHRACCEPSKGRQHEQHSPSQARQRAYRRWLSLGAILRYIRLRACSLPAACRHPGVRGRIAREKEPRRERESEKSEEEDKSMFLVTAPNNVHLAFSSADRARARLQFTSTSRLRGVSALVSRVCVCRGFTVRVLYSD
jgi:hypothetical protein